MKPTATSTARADDLMSLDPVTCDRDVTLRDAASVMAEHNVGSVVIIDDGHLAGILSERDVVLALADGANPDEIWVADVMSDDPVVIGPDTYLDEIVDKMAGDWLRHLPVVQKGKVQGMVSTRDVVLELAGIGSLEAD